MDLSQALLDRLLAESLRAREFAHAPYSKYQVGVALLDEQGVTLDPAARKEIVWQMQDILNEDLPYIWVAQKQSIAAYSKSWGGLSEPFLMGLSKIPWDRIHQVG